jgi:hypothetical protein
VSLFSSCRCAVGQGCAVSACVSGRGVMVVGVGRWALNARVDGLLLASVLLFCPWSVDPAFRMAHLSVKVCGTQGLFCLSETVDGRRFDGLLQVSTLVGIRSWPVGSSEFWSTWTVLSSQLAGCGFAAVLRCAGRGAPPRCACRVFCPCRRPPLPVGGVCSFLGVNVYNWQITLAHS